jgi:hypothetical protein
MSKSTREIKELLIAAGREAAEDLMRVAKEKIVVSGKDPLAADKLKNAAASKKLCIFDGFDILDRCQIEEDRIKDIDNPPTPENQKITTTTPNRKIKTDFDTPEQRS